MKKLTRVSSDCSGVGSFIQALNRLGIEHEESFACDFDYYARQTYLLNFGTADDVELSNTKEHKKYCDGVQKIALSHKVPSAEEVTFLNEANEFAKKFSFYYPFNMYQREIPKESDDIYMGSFPCQSFSLAGSRQGEASRKGILFYEGHRYIQTNKPRYFIIENVKGLLSDDGGKTFQRWIDYLGGKSVNGNPVIFPHENSTPYHVYYQVMNAKHYGVPQNRERIFIIGIRDDADNDFSFPKPFHLVKRLKDVLESEVDEKYFLSDSMLNHFATKTGVFSGMFKPMDSDSEGTASCIPAVYHKMPITNTYINEVKIGAIRGRNPTNPLSRVSGLPTEQMLEINESGVCNALTTVQKDNVVVIPANNSKGYDIAEEEEDSINFSNPNSETRRGRVGHGVAQTLDTSCNQGVLVKIQKWYENENKEIEADDIIQTGQTNMRGERIYKTGISPTLPAENPRVVSVLNTQRIRRLTPKECFSLMDFNEDFKWDVSDSQAYKQAGNSIVVNCLVEIISKLKL